MEFWGVEVKPGKPLKIEPEDGYIIHVSQASLGELKKENESFTLYVKVGDQKLVMGTLMSERLPQISLDLFFDQQFELSHHGNGGSVYVLGYKSPQLMDEEDLCSDVDYPEDEQIPMALAGNGKPKAEELKLKKELKAEIEETKKGVSEEDEFDSEEDESDPEEGDESDDDDSEDVSDSKGADETSLSEDASDDSDDEEDDKETPKKVEPLSKKRPNGAAAKIPAAKKAKTVPPQKTDGKKAKAGQSPKSGGGRFSFGSHKQSKGKHGAK